MTAYHLAAVAILLVSAGLTWRAGDTGHGGRHHAARPGTRRRLAQQRKGPRR